MSPGAVRKRRILIVEDDDELREAYRRFFADHCAAEFSAATVPDAERALSVLRDEPIDLMILDWNLPGISGAALAKAVRAHGVTRAVGILMVTGKSHASETVFALDAGADDYLVKPFEWSVLLARLRSLARRADLTLEKRLSSSFPGLTLDLDADRLLVDGAEVSLTPKEMGLLRVFLTRPSILHPQRFLWEALWGYEADGWDHTLSVTISSLRGKLGKKWGPHLQSHKGRGYVFER